MGARALIHSGRGRTGGAVTTPLSSPRPRRPRPRRRPRRRPTLRPPRSRRRLPLPRPRPPPPRRRPLRPRRLRRRLPARCRRCCLRPRRARRLRTRERAVDPRGLLVRLQDNPSRPPFGLCFASVGDRRSGRMIIVCPACQSRYKFDESKLGERPKAKTRCAKCGATIEIENPLLAAMTLPPGTRPPIPPPTAPPPEREPGTDTSRRAVGVPGVDEVAGQTVTGKDLHKM